MPYDYLIGILYLFPKKDRKYNGKKIEDTNEVIIRHRSKKDRKYNGKKIEDTNEVIIRHRSKKDRKYNGKKIEDTNEVIIPHWYPLSFCHCIFCPSLIYAL
jgi:bifunctional DNA-binding transcriptional regulator/antitoxin component of YhaV-PrlF toxin-antitoxin module